MTNGEKIVEAMRDAVAYARGDKSRGQERVVMVPREVDVRAIRHQLGLSQPEFAAQFGFSLGTLRNWEQGHRQPEGPSRVLLTLIERIPDEIKRALQEPRRRSEEAVAV